MSSDTEKLKPDVPPVPYTKLFRFASVWDSVILAIGLLCSVANGVVMPIFSIFFGTLFDGH
jgi:hypothetical protein